MATARSESVSYTAIQRVAVQTNELLIVTHRYLYVIEDTRRYATGALLLNALANRKHGCRFVIGEDIKYAQEKGYLWVLDPDGKECKIPVIRQQVLDKDSSAYGGAPHGASPATPTMDVVATRAGPTAPNPPQPVLPAGPGDLIEMAFTSNPPGALVSIYGTAVGRTPFITKLAAGTYKAVFSADGYYDLTQSISVGPGNSNLVHAAFELK